jgi:hypothetical protein
MSNSRNSGYNFSGEYTQRDYAANSAATEQDSINPTVLLFRDMDVSFRHSDECYIYAGRRMAARGLPHIILSKGLTDRRLWAVGSF